MTDADPKQALTRQTSGHLTAKATGRHPILTRMTEGVLETIREKERSLQTTRFPLGGYEFREADYQQIMRWAKALDSTPEAVLAILEVSTVDYYFFDEDKVIEWRVE